MAFSQPQKSVLITGGSGGVGRAIARKLMEEKYQVITTGLKEKNEIIPPFFKCDLRKPEEVQQLYEWTREQIGIPDILILSAGIGIKEKLSEGDPEKWQKVFDTNVMGTLRCLRAFLPQMMEKNHAHIIFISSVAAFQTYEYGAIYSASKTALEIIAETLRIETSAHLKITTINPGAIDTGFFMNQLSGYAAADREMNKMKPEEIAEDVWYCIQQSNKRNIQKLITRPMGQIF